MRMWPAVKNLKSHEIFDETLQMKFKYNSEIPKFLFYQSCEFKQF